MLGLPYLPPFADTTEQGTDISRGVNYASAAAGILDETRQFLVISSLCFLEQFLFRVYVCVFLELFCGRILTTHRPNDSAGRTH